MHFFKWLFNIKIFYKIFSKKVLEIFFVSLVVLFIIFSPNLIFNENNFRLNYNNYFSLSNDEIVVLDLWHIETFEGGSASRGSFLEKVAMNFNKRYKNVYISIKNLTEEQLILNLKDFSPDLFSFGIGVGENILSYLSALDDNVGIRKELLEFGKNNNEIYAYPYILSGYVSITKEKYIEESSYVNLKTKTVNKKEKKGVSFCKEGNINVCKCIESLTCIEELTYNDYFESKSSYDAYCNFLDNDFITLIGTARDLARCKNRESNGSLESCNYSFLGEYTDLVQYIGVNKNSNADKKIIANEFVKYLVSSENQLKLSNIGLFSVLNQKIYSNDYMSIFEDVLHNCKIQSVNAFISKSQIEKNKQISFDNIFTN